MVIEHQIVIDGLGDMDGAEIIVQSFRLLVDDAHCIGRIIAADVEKVAHVMLAEDVEDLLAVLFIGLVTGAAKGGGRRHRHALQVIGGFLRQVKKIIVDDAVHAVDRAVHLGDLAEFTAFQHHADQALVDYRCRAAALGDDDFAFKLHAPYSFIYAFPLQPRTLTIL